MLRFPASTEFGKRVPKRKQRVTFCCRTPSASSARRMIWTRRRSVDTSWKCCRGFARNKTNNEKCLRADVIGSEVLHYSCDFLGGYFSAHFFSISDNSSISSGEGPSKSSSTAMPSNSAKYEKGSKSSTNDLQ